MLDSHYNNNVDVSDQSEVKSGEMKLLIKDGTKSICIPVTLKVVKNCFEHYAIFSKAQQFQSQSTFLNLKNSIVTNVDGCDKQIRVLQNNYEGQYIILEANDVSSAQVWLNVMKSHCQPSSPRNIPLSPSSSPRLPRSPIMKTVTETDEEDDYC